MNWQPLEKDQLDILLSAVASKGMPGLFSLESSKAQFAELPFYNGYALYDLRNYSTLPVFTMQYLGDGKDFYYLDGSADPIYQVNRKPGALNLNQDTALDYLSFFFSHVAILGETEETEMIRDPESLPYYDYLSENQKTVIRAEKDAAHVEYNSAGNSFIVESPLYYGGSLVKARIEIDKIGHVMVKDYKLLFGMSVRSDRQGTTAS